MSNLGTSTPKSYDFRSDSDVSVQNTKEKSLKLSIPEMFLLEKCEFLSSLGVTYIIDNCVMKLKGSSEEFLDKCKIKILEWHKNTKRIHFDVQRMSNRKIENLTQLTESLNEMKYIHAEICNDEHEPAQECLALFYNSIDKEQVLHLFRKACLMENKFITACAHMLSMSVIFGDITEEQADVIVSSSPPDLSHLNNGVISEAILRKSGPKLQEVCSAKGSLKADEIFETDSFDMKSCKKIFHITLGSLEAHNNLASFVEKQITSCLKKANNDVTLLAFPTIGFGILRNNNFEKQKLMKSYFRSIERFAENQINCNLKEIKFVIKDKSLYKEFETHLKSLIADAESAWRDIL